jgi:hypothetical protein
MLNIPATRKTQVRGPLASTQARKDPVPESFVFVTSITAPPRPPTELAPPPSAPGNAGQFDPPQEALEGGGCVAAAVIVRAAEADLLESALLVAVTVSVPAFVGALYTPDELIAPNAAVHVTDLSVAVP